MRPSRAIWTAWTLALIGGLAVLVAAGLVLNDPCAGRAPCPSRTVSVATVLALIGTVLAVAGGVATTILTVRRTEAHHGRGSSSAG